MTYLMSRSVLSVLFISGHFQALILKPLLDSVLEIGGGEQELLAVLTSWHLLIDCFHTKLHVCMLKRWC